MEIITTESVLVATLRIILGILFFFQGYDKVVKLGLSKVIETYKHELGSIKIPGFIVSLSAYYTSFIELIGGAMLIFGLFTKYVLVAFGIDLIMVVFVFSIMQPLWDMKLVFPRIILWSILMAFCNQDVLSLDYFIK